MTLSLIDRIRLSFFALKSPLDLRRGQRPAVQFDSIKLEIVDWNLNPRGNIDSIFIRKITAR